MESVFAYSAFFWALQDHPGGPQIVMDASGKDATDE